MESENISLKSAQSLETRQRVLAAALKLFNESGVDAVTTHDIAEAANMSPGNLYYHFKNKKAIVRGLFYKIEIFSVNKWHEKSPANREIRFADFMQFFFGALTTYQFFFRDFSSILTNDPVLEKEWRRAYDRLFSVMQEALDGWIKQGLIKPFENRKGADTFIETIWIIAAFSEVHLRARFGSVKNNRNLATYYLAQFLYPYHTQKGQRVIDLYR
jgi:AcrR family transcriptional regulator